MHRVVVAALVRDGRVLLVHRSADRQAYPGVWDLPGGHVEADETALEALERELREELDVQVSAGPAAHLCRWDAGNEEPVRFDAWLVGQWRGAAQNAAPEEHDEIRWFRRDELPPLVHEELAAALADALEGLSWTDPRSVVSAERPPRRRDR